MKNNYFFYLLNSPDNIIIWATIQGIYTFFMKLFHIYENVLEKYFYNKNIYTI